MVSGIALLKCSNMAAPYLASIWSATVASPRRKAAADRTRGAWPQRVRALAEKTSIVVWNVAGAKTLPVKKVDSRALGCEATLKIQGLVACCGESQPHRHPTGTLRHHHPSSRCSDPSLDATIIDSARSRPSVPTTPRIPAKRHSSTHSLLRVVWWRVTHFQQHFDDGRCQTKHSLQSL
jgi:hypothetical protein